MIVCACGKQVPTQSEWAGQWITCPGCGGSLYAPFPGDKPSVPTAAPEPTRLCALCAETIPVSDVRCRYCGSDPTGVRPAAPTPPAPTRPTSKDDGLPVLIVGLLGFLICQLVAPLAWSMGNAYEARCRARGEVPAGNGRAGKILGIIGTVLLVVSIAGFALSVVAQCL